MPPVFGGAYVLDKPLRELSRKYGKRTTKKPIRADPETPSHLDINNVKVGHLGTLDAFATGVLPTFFGAATRLISHVPQSPKRYVARLKLGVETDSGDPSGSAVEEGPPGWALPAESDVSALCAARFVGDVRQTPPKLSAIHIDGERAYARARRNENFEMPSRVVHVHSLGCRAVAPDELELDVTCGSGTYIRTLGMDLARALGTRGHICALRRTDVGVFSVPTEREEDTEEEEDSKGDMGTEGGQGPGSGPGPRLYRMQDILALFPRVDSARSMHDTLRVLQHGADPQRLIKRGAPGLPSSEEKPFALFSGGEARALLRFTPSVRRRPFTYVSNLSVVQ